MSKSLPSGVLGSMPEAVADVAEAGLILQLRGIIEEQECADSRGWAGGTASPSQPRRPTDSHALKCRRLSATTTRVMAGLDNRGIVTV